MLLLCILCNSEGMDARQFLENYARQQRIIDNNEYESQEAQKKLNSLPAKVTYNGIGQAERELKKALKTIIKECDARSAAARQKCEEIRAAVDAVQDPRHREILQRRYLQRRPETWESIAKQMNYSVENCHKLHRAALKQFKP